MSTPTRPRPPKPGDVAYEDVDDLISTATRLMQKDAAPETLTPEDVQRIGQELDIPPEYIERAREELSRRREQEEAARREAEAADKARRERLRARVRLGGMAAAGLAVVLGLFTLSVHNGLNGTLQDVTRQRAQVRNVLDRQEAVQSRYATSAPGPERDAQLSGAENRVAVEKRRYDQAATEYNASASSFPQSMVVGLTGLPRAVPLSTEVSTW